MANKDNKAPKKKAGKKIGATAKDLGYEFGVGELADELGVEPATVRVQLRNKGVAKNGSVYGWKNRKEFDAVLKTLKAAKKADDAPKKAARAKTDDAPKKAAKAKPAKKLEPKKQSKARKDNNETQSEPGKD